MKASESNLLWVNSTTHISFILMFMSMTVCICVCVCVRKENISYLFHIIKYINKIIKYIAFSK